MKVLSLQRHVHLTKVQEKNVNDLVAKVITEACSNMPSMRNVLQGDMQQVFKDSRLRKAS
ncbi:hypothetical protein D7V64_16840 [Acinetobacter cumulans]|uniref:Uncharacterized protein n=1 Tax=Acinetobacter cumulans TaxID=2136182 RepID=A0A3A8FMD9_9GAMM|nr:hypothetical protein [Acinetobacter cumulans]RKG47399.1 hypothetical protein D7V64_16840 [Acinetobacter cumulans]